MKSYTLSKMGATHFILMLLPTFYTLLMLAVLGRNIPVIPLLLGLSFSVLGLAAFLTLPFKINVYDDGNIELKSLLKRKIISSQEILIIDVRKWRRGFAIIKHTKGSTTIFRTMNGIYDFIDTVKGFNPSVELRGANT